MTQPSPHAARAPRCESCHARPAPHTTLCSTCTTTLRTAARRIGELHPDLDVVEQRQTRYSSGGLGGSSGIGKVQPLPVDTRFADATGAGSVLVADTRTVLDRWCRLLLAEWPPLAPADPICEGVCNHRDCIAVRRRTPPADTVTARCAYLIRMAGAIAVATWAPDCLDELLDLERRHKRLVDRPAERWYAGVCGAIIEPERDDRPHDGTTCACACHNGPGYPCDIDGGCGLEYATTEPAAPVVCTRVLQAEPGRKEIRCTTCGTTHPVEARRAQLLREAEDREATVEVLTRIVTTLMGWDVSSARLGDKIRRWSEKDRIASHGTRVVAGRARPTYRVGDVVRLLAQEGAASQQLRGKAG